MQRGREWQSVVFVADWWTRDQLPLGDPRRRTLSVSLSASEPGGMVDLLRRSHRCSRLATLLVCDRHENSAAGSSAAPDLHGSILLLHSGHLTNQPRDVPVPLLPPVALQLLRSCSGTHGTPQNREMDCHT